MSCARLLPPVIAPSSSPPACGARSETGASRTRPTLSQLIATGLLLALGGVALAQTPQLYPSGSQRQRILEDWVRMGYKIPTGEVIVQLSPNANRKVTDYIAQNAKATTLTVKAGQHLGEAIHQKCGQATSQALTSYLHKLIPTLQIDPATLIVKQPVTIEIPACAKFVTTRPTYVGMGDTLGTLVDKSFSGATPSVLTPEVRKAVQDSILKKNPYLAAQDNLQAGQAITLPFVTEPVRLKLKPGVNVSTFLKELTELAKQTEELASKDPPFFPAGFSTWRSVIRAEEVEPEAIVFPPVPTSDAGPMRKTTCSALTEHWPFNAQAVAEAVSKLPSRTTAVVAVIDTGIAGVSEKEYSEIFPEHVFSINTREKAAAISGAIDPDFNRYNGDIIGIQFPVIHIPGAKHHPPAPIGKDLYKYWDHGTHVAGLILGGVKLFDPKGGAGASSLRDKILNNRLKLKIINVTTPAGQTQEFAHIVPSYFYYALDYALDYAKKNEVHVINISLSSTTKLVMREELKQANIVFVVAAGNDGRSLSESDGIYPGRWSRGSDIAMTVAASDGTRDLADFSNRGETYADIAAPGCKIPSFVGGTPAEVKTYSGTSQAAPHVSLTAALLISAGVSRVKDVRDRILLSADTEPKLAGKVRWGALLNIPKALSIYDDLVERKSDPVGTFTPGDLTHPLRFKVCGETSSIEMTRMRKISAIGNDKVRFIFEDHSGNHLVDVPCPYDDENDLLFTARSDGEARKIKLTEVRDVVFRMPPQ